jgi:hypothetical protein
MRSATSRWNTVNQAVVWRPRLDRQPRYAKPAQAGRFAPARGGYDGESGGVDSNALPGTISMWPELWRAISQERARRDCPARWRRHVAPAQAARVPAGSGTDLDDIDTSSGPPSAQSGG